MYDTLYLDRKLVRYASLGCKHANQWPRFEAELIRLWVVHDFALEAQALQPEDISNALGDVEGGSYAESELYERLRLAHAALTETLTAARLESAPLTQDKLKDVHARLCHGHEMAAGRCRKHNQQPSGYDHEIVKAASLNYHLRKLVAYANEDLMFEHPVVAAAKLHLVFMQAWPFDQRSGRAGRLLMNQWLMSAGYPPALLTGYDRQAYFAALKSNCEETMIKVVAEGVERSMAAAERYLAARRIAA